MRVPGTRAWSCGRVAGLVLVASLLAPAEAAAQRARTCVEVQVAGIEPGEAAPEQEGLAALVRAELDRHPTHVASADGCESHLRVELVAIEGRRFVTGRINWQVPHRVEVEGGELPEAVGELLRVVLHNDPMTLRGPGDESGAIAALGRLRRHGRNLYGLEVYELTAVVSGHVEGLPGLGFRLRRELVRWHLAVRVGFAARPSAPPPELALRAVGDLTLEMGWFSSDTADVAAYAAALLGVSHHWLRGPLREEPDRFDDVNSTGVIAGLRAGVELLRTTTTRMDLFVELHLPLFSTRDEAESVLRTWLPTLSLGAGISL